MILQQPKPGILCNQLYQSRIIYRQYGDLNKQQAAHNHIRSSRPSRRAVKCCLLLL